MMGMLSALSPTGLQSGLQSVLSFGSFGSSRESYSSKLQDEDATDDDDLHALVRCGTPQSLAKLRAALITQAHNPHVLDAEGRSLLHVAAAEKMNSTLQAQMIAELVSHGLGLADGDKAGMSPIHTAAAFGNVAALEAMLEGGGNANILDGQDQTPLHMCMSMLGDTDGKIKCVLALLRRACWLDPLDRNGLSPLHYAADAGNLQAVKELVRSGAKRSIVGPGGVTPLGLAQNKGHKHVVLWLNKFEKTVMAGKRVSYE